ncbi:MAG: hypothetical protein JXA41_09975 [Deltaproteobacteria bacterium]|nr:hypothetical protein [Deltaproteobacteria bacterium]
MREASHPQEKNQEQDFIVACHHFTIRDSTIQRNYCEAHTLSNDIKYETNQIKQMSTQYNDENTYQFHEEDISGRCFICKYPTEKMLIVRQIKSMKLVHLCADCMFENLSEYLLDNTRPWAGKK